MDAGVVANIMSELARIEREERVAIPLAVESGSRAWGFPSPDSDYDCRFVFVRAAADTFTLFPKRDVIERPVTPVFDINGWELSKALKLLLNGNAVIIEWLTSPFAYRVDEAFRTAFLSLAESVAERGLVASHYFHLADNQMKRNISNQHDIAIKKLFYVLRPLMALRWLESHPGAAVAPMHFPTLCEAAGLDRATLAAVGDLLARKAQTRELGEAAAPPSLLAFIADEYRRAEALWGDRPPRGHDEERIAAVDAFWRRWVSQLAPRVGGNP